MPLDFSRRGIKNFSVVPGGTDGCTETMSFLFKPFPMAKATSFTALKSALFFLIRTGTHIIFNFESREA
jgi:hypothetical protein